MKRGRPLRRTNRIAPRSKKAIAADVALADASAERRQLTRGWCEGSTPACRPGAHLGQHAHHVKRRSQGGGHTVDNLRWLCWEGHEWVHRNPAAAAGLGLLHRTTESTL